MTAMTTAMAEAYFRAPPRSDFLTLPDQLHEVLACPVSASPWDWNPGVGLLRHRHTGETKLRTGFVPGVEHISNRTTVGEINAEVHMHQVDAREREGGIGLEGDVGRTIWVDGVAKRLRGDGAEWREKQAPLRREEQMRRVKKFHPLMLNEKPADFISKEDRQRFHEEAKNIMAQIVNLTRFLPRCEIQAVKQPTRLLELVEREMFSLEGANRERTQQIAAEYRALGGGVPEITNMKIERLQQQKQGFSFQYAYNQLLFAAWEEAAGEIMLEYEGLATSLPGVEFVPGPGGQKAWNYIKLRDRVERRKKLAKETDKAWAAQKAMLLGSSMEDYYRWLSKRTTYQPRHGQPSTSEATPETAQPMSGWEIDSDPNDRE